MRMDSSDSGSVSTVYTVNKMKYPVFVIINIVMQLELGKEMLSRVLSKNFLLQILCWTRILRSIVGLDRIYSANVFHSVSAQQYLVDTKWRNFTESRKFCFKMMRDIVQIHNESENADLAAMAAKNKCVSIFFGRIFIPLLYGFGYWRSVAYAPEQYVKDMLTDSEVERYNDVVRMDTKDLKWHVARPDSKESCTVCGPEFSTVSDEFVKLMSVSCLPGSPDDELEKILAPTDEHYCLMRCREIGDECVYVVTRISKLSFIVHEWCTLLKKCDLRSSIMFDYAVLVNVKSIGGEPRPTTYPTTHSTTVHEVSETSTIPDSTSADSTSADSTSADSTSAGSTSAGSTVTHSEAGLLSPIETVGISISAALVLLIACVLYGMASGKKKKDGNATATSPTTQPPAPASTASASPAPPASTASPDPASDAYVSAAEG